MFLVCPKPPQHNPSFVSQGVCKGTYGSLLKATMSMDVPNKREVLSSNHDFMDELFNPCKFNFFNHGIFFSINFYQSNFIHDSVENSQMIFFWMFIHGIWMTFIPHNKIVNELHFTDEMKLLIIFIWIKISFIVRFHKFSQMDFHSIIHPHLLK